MCSVTTEISCVKLSTSAVEVGPVNLCYFLTNYKGFWFVLNGLLYILFAPTVIASDCLGDECLGP